MGDETERDIVQQLGELLDEAYPGRRWAGKLRALRASLGEGPAEALVQGARTAKPKLVWEKTRWNGEYLELKPPAGYRISHSWPSDPRTMVVCWEREDDDE